MKTPLRTLTCALAAASAIAAVPAGANPGPQRVDRRARRERDAEERRADDALARRQRADPGPARLPAAGRDDARRARRPLVRRQDGDPLLLAAGRGRALALPRRRERQAHAAGLPRAPSRSTPSLRAGRPSTSRAARRPRTPRSTRCSCTAAPRRRSTPSPRRSCSRPRARRRPSGWTMQGQPLDAHDRCGRQLGLHALRLARVPVHPRAAARERRLGGVHRAAGGLARSRVHAAAAHRPRATRSRC